MSDQKLKIAVFIDFDNVEIGVKTTLGLQFDIGAVLEAIKERGEIVTKVAFGDWKRSGDYGRAMSNHAVRLVQRVMTPGGDKNGADINLALDALEMAFTHAHINAFVIVGGDSDFITLVEKLKQYDRKVFVVGGRAFTSQVMQKNCTEFIAYENIVPDRRAVARHDRGERLRVAGSQSIDGAVALVKRALKVLLDREVTPQLGLLKSTLLQLDSSFSERDYGCGSFREFAEKLAERGVVTLKHQGRSTLVEIVEGGPEIAETTPRAESADEAVVSGTDGAGAIESAAEGDVTADAADEPGAVRPGETPYEAGRRQGREAMRAEGGGYQRREFADPAVLADGVALVRRVLSEATTPPRWPMYPRQFKQFLRAADPTFDERKYGSIAELMRACQKEGLLKLERDRQGGLRVFSASGQGSVRAGWPGGPPAPYASGAELSDEQPRLPASTDDDDIPDDIGNRIIGGAVDVTRELVGAVGMPRTATPLTDDEIDEANDPPQPLDNESPALKAVAKPRRARKTPVARKTAAKRTTTARAPRRTAKKG
ncbi:MAG: NYN domain-containing protein [Acidobacteria bacterium]|nr:NYN domain-containing protein [Acidobacteriota bacterium]